MLPVLVEGDDLHRNVPRRRILLELAQHGPSEHVGQEHVERHGGRLVLACERQRVGAAHRHQDLEPGVVSQIGQYSGVMRIVLDDQQCRVARLQYRPVVGHLFDRQLRQTDRGESCRGGRR